MQAASLSAARHLQAASRSLQQRLRGWTVPGWALDSRPAASITLAAIAIAFAAGLMLAPSPIAMPTTATEAAQVQAVATQETQTIPTQIAIPAQVAAAPRESVKIVGGTPRSDNCAEQVWPYIEYRCLTPAADRPPATAQLAAAAQPARATPVEPTGSADAANDAQRVSPEIARSPIAIARLSLPPRQAGVIPDGTAGEIGLSASDRRTDGWASPAAERPTVDKPRHRAGRRAYRSRYGRGWGRRHGFLF